MKQSKKSKRVLRGRSVGIMIEDFDAKLDLIIEKVESSEKKLTERIDELSGKVDRIESEVIGIRVLLGRHEEMLKRHEEDIVFLKQSSHH